MSSLQALAGGIPETRTLTLSDLGISRGRSSGQGGGAYLKVVPAVCWSHLDYSAGRPCHVVSRGSSLRHLGNRGGTQCHAERSPGPSHSWDLGGHLLLELQ